MNAGTRPIRSMKLSFFAAALIIIALPFAAHAHADATLATDKDDYVPGEIAMITGAGYWPGEPIDLSIAIFVPSSGQVILDYDWETFFADEVGEFVAYYTIPNEAADMWLTATGLGLESGLVAGVTFTDSVTSANITSPTTASPATITSLPATIPVSFTYSTSVAGTTTATISVPGVGILASQVVPSGGTPASPLSAVLNITIPAGTLNGPRNVQLTVNNPAGSGAQNGNDNEPGAIIINVPQCTATNSAPTVSGSDINLGAILPPDGTPIPVQICVTDFSPQTADVDGDAVAVSFPGSLNCIEVMLSSTNVPFAVTLEATDNGSLRSQLNCPPLQNLTTTTTVNVNASTYNCPTNDAPIVTVLNDSFHAGDFCLADGVTEVEIPIDLSLFAPSVVDPDGDPFNGPALSAATVTLSLPLDVSDANPVAYVTISATDDPSARELLGCPLSAMTGSIQVAVTADLHRNRAPQISADDLNLGQIVGCLIGGSFQITHPVSPASFNAQATDPDGDSVVIVADVSSVTLIGPGVASAQVELTATDDPIVRTAGTCAPRSTCTTATITVQVIYNFEGFKPPLNNSSATKVKRGSAVPVKFRLSDCGGNEICDDSAGPHTIVVYFHQGNAPAGSPDVDDAGSSGDNGINFRYSDVCGFSQWIFNLKTNNTYALNATYRVVANLNDGTTHEVFISIK